MSIFGTIPNKIFHHDRADGSARANVVLPKPVKTLAGNGGTVFANPRD